MAIVNSDAGEIGKPFRLKNQGLRLCIFIHKRLSGFSLDRAIATLCELESSDHDEIKSFAKRLQRGLETCRVKIPYTAALQAAHVLKDHDWHKATQAHLMGIAA